MPWYLILICPQEPLKSLRPRKVSTPTISSQKAREEKTLLPLELQDDGSDSEWGCVGQLTKLECDDKLLYRVRFTEVDNCTMVMNGKSLFLGSIH